MERPEEKKSDSYQEVYEGSAGIFPFVLVCLIICMLLWIKKDLAQVCIKYSVKEQGSYNPC